MIKSKHFQFSSSLYKLFLIFSFFCTFTTVNAKSNLQNFVSSQENIEITLLNTVIFVNSDKNFDLTEQNFKSLLTDLKNGETTLFKQIFVAHSEDCINFLKIKFQANHNDAYDATLDTLIEYRQRLVDGKINYGNLRFLFLQMASQHYQRVMKKEKIYDSNDIEDANFLEITDHANYNEDQLQTLEKAFDSIEGECKQLLKMNFYGNLKLNEIADKLGKSHDAVRKQKQRCMDALIKIFNKISFS